MFYGGLYKVLFVVKKCSMWMICVMELSELQKSLPIKCLPVTWRETEYPLDVCRASNGANTGICWAHDFSISPVHFMAEVYVMFYVIAN